jgi:hypothetical protein
VIYDNVPKTNGGQQSILWTFNVAPGTSIRVTGFTVHGQAQDTQVYNAGTLYFGGSSRAVRIDHITCEQPGTGFLMFKGDIWGVVDHCVFDYGFHEAIQVSTVDGTVIPQAGVICLGRTRNTMARGKASTSRIARLTAAGFQASAWWTALVEDGSCSDIIP